MIDSKRSDFSLILGLKSATVCLEDFKDLLIKITPILETKYPKMAKISSGSPLNVELLELLGLG